MERERIKQGQDLRVYQQASSLAMVIFDLSSGFPATERYSLTDQVRRSSRSVSANLAEAWQKRAYRAAFVAKLSDSAAEAAETAVWLEFAEKCRYISVEHASLLTEQCRQVTAQLVVMMNRPDPWLLQQR